ncbi:hypothetical protein JYK04_00855 [Streptomyces nojiriensis]|nr:hypothetical protein JYK04_00855 [Streptomyces nojiriensis]
MYRVPPEPRLPRLPGFTHPDRTRNRGGRRSLEVSRSPAASRRPSRLPGRLTRLPYATRPNRPLGEASFGQNTFHGQQSRDGPGAPGAGRCRRADGAGAGRSVIPGHWPGSARARAGSARESADRLGLIGGPAERRLGRVGRSKGNVDRCPQGGLDFDCRGWPVAAQGCAAWAAHLTVTPATAAARATAGFCSAGGASRRLRRLPYQKAPIRRTTRTTPAKMRKSEAWPSAASVSMAVMRGPYPRSTDIPDVERVYIARYACAAVRRPQRTA